LKKEERVKSTIEHYSEERRKILVDKLSLLRKTYINQFNKTCNIKEEIKLSKYLLLDDTIKPKIEKNFASINTISIMKPKTSLLRADSISSDIILNLNRNFSNISLSNFKRTPLNLSLDEALFMKGDCLRMKSTPGAKNDQKSSRSEKSTKRSAEECAKIYNQDEISAEILIKDSESKNKNKTNEIESNLNSSIPIQNYISNKDIELDKQKEILERKQIKEKIRKYYVTDMDKSDSKYYFNNSEKHSHRNLILNTKEFEINIMDCLAFDKFNSKLNDVSNKTKPSKKKFLKEESKMNNIEDNNLKTCKIKLVTDCLAYMDDQKIMQKCRI